MIQGSLAWSTETGTHDTREGHPVEEMEEDRVWANQVKAEVGGTILSDDAVGATILPCIHNAIYVY